MKKSSRFVLALLAVSFFTTASVFSQIVFDGTPGTAAPPATLGSYTMTAFPGDGYGNFVNLTSVPAPTGNLTFGAAVNTRTVPGGGWATWSHGYTGRVYFSNGALSLTMTLPANTQAFYFYAEPNLFSTFTITATAQDLTTSGPISVSGSSGAKYYGFFSTNGVPLASIAINAEAGSGGFSVGEFGIAQCEAPSVVVTVDPSMLWPPNHKMADINATVAVTGGCGTSAVSLVSVTSNEPDNGDDDGNTINDVQGVDPGADYQFSVRKERSGIGTGRIYTATYSATDQFGNVGTASATITVPLSMSKSGNSLAAAELLELGQNYPNPFNPSTTIGYTVPADGLVTLAVYDFMGRQVTELVNEHKSAGTYTAAFDAATLASGTYVYRLSMGDQVLTRTMTLSK